MRVLGWDDKPNTLLSLQYYIYINTYTHTYICCAVLDDSNTGGQWTPFSTLASRRRILLIPDHLETTSMLCSMTRSLKSSRRRRPSSPPKMSACASISALYCPLTVLHQMICGAGGGVGGAITSRSQRSRVESDLDAC